MVEQVTNYDFNDYSDEIELIPNQWGLLQGMGLFTEDSVSSGVLQFDEVTRSLVLIKDQRRGTRKQVNREDYGKLHTIGIPHFPFDDVIRPEDIINKRRLGTKDQAETVANVRANKMERMRKSWASTLEFAKMQAIMGDVYNPNLTNDVQSWYTEFGVTQKEVEFELDTTTTDVLAKGEEALSFAQDNILSGEIVSDFVAICSKEFFSSLIAHPEIKEAYKYYSSDQSPLRQRLTGAQDARYRQFEFGGILYVEYRGSFADELGAAQRIVPANEAYLIPRGTSDTFLTYYAPADRFEYINTAGQSQYMFEFPDGRGHLIELESESNFINMVRRPESVIKLHRNTIASP